MVQRLSRTGRQAVVTALTARGERVLQSAMDVHFDGVLRMFVQYLTDADIDRMIDLSRRLREPNPERHDVGGCQGHVPPQDASGQE